MQLLCETISCCECFAQMQVQSDGTEDVDNPPCSERSDSSAETVSDLGQRSPLINCQFSPHD